MQEDVIEGGTRAGFQNDFGKENKKMVDLSCEENHTNSEEDERRPH